ncbi:MAG: tyrosine-protein phosphatase, partial [Chloroflexia bacterium]|nr:tyrosine-protein phosphatase [Chloroflexia bacterium]
MCMQRASQTAAPGNNGAPARGARTPLAGGLTGCIHGRCNRPTVGPVPYLPVNWYNGKMKHHQTTNQHITMHTLLRSTTVLSMGLAVMGLLLHRFNRGRRRLATHPASLPPERREAHRRIKLAGAANLRDLGGYATHDGRQVRWGSLYRSDHLHHLSRRDQQILQQLGLVTLIDLRSEAERLRQPNRLPANHGINV